jgi:hypothetical protein
MRAALLALALVLAAAPPVRGHGRSVSYATWELAPGTARVELRLARADALRMEATAGAPIAALLRERVQVLVDDAPCTPDGAPTPRQAAPPWIAYGFGFGCPQKGALAITSRLATAPAHLHFVRVAFADGTTRERVLSATETRWDVGSLDTTAPVPGAAGTSLLGYVALGVEHIASGWDHLAFLLALLLLARSLGEVVRLVTAFTLAHSVTLALAVLDVVRPEPAAVEALIGLSIALVAAENAWLLAGRDRVIPRVVVGALAALAVPAAYGLGAVPAVTCLGLALFAGCHFGLLARTPRPGTLRGLVAFAFGLVHGLGFAGVLAELALPTGRLVPALLGFNLGVELGQLAVVALAWPALRALGRLDEGRWGLATARVGSAAACGLGVFWFVTRLAG